ncbi:MAG: hypothetical protein QG637_1248, partial [Chloroflexota bacterium]|nr:hypothetical protein [Chloroflexota bacterium]
HIINGVANSQRLGGYLSAGDASGDHVPDLLAGAPSENKGYLFLGDFNPGGVAGIARVEIGWFGPVIDATQPVSGTLPASWQAAALVSPNAAITPWTGQLTATALGDYRLYARGFDRAGNRTDAANWYLGNVWVTGAGAPFGGNVILNAPVVTNQTQLALAGSLNTTAQTRHFRVYDGYVWRRLPPTPGAWSQNSLIPRSDRRNLTMHAIARDAFGNTAQAQRSLLVDTLVAPPVLAMNLPVGVWQTDASPNLVISWPAPSDANGIAGTWAVVDTVRDTVPATPAAGNLVARSLNAAGVYYAHVRVRDNAGNENTVHSGPYLVNRTLTPSVILPDGIMQLAGGEYPGGTLLNYDPYAARKPAGLWGTWDATRLYLGFPGGGWDQSNRLALYFDTQPGGLTSGLALSSTHTLPFAADFALVVGGATPDAFTLYRASGSWAAVAAPVSFVVREMDTEMALDRAEIGATGAVKLVAVAEDAQGVWAVLPAAARPTTATHISGPVTLAAMMQWPSLANGVKPNAGLSQFVAPQVTVLPAWDNVTVSGREISFKVVVRNPDVAPYVNAPLDLQVDPKLALLSVQGATCQTCPPNASQWTLLANVAAGGTQTATVQARVGGQNVNGIAPLSISAGLANSGLPGQPQARGQAQYLLDHGTVTLLPINPAAEIYVKPGSYEISAIPIADFSTALRCLADVEVNPGELGWTLVCPLGDCTTIPGTIPSGGAQNVDVRVTSGNGHSSQPVRTKIIADAIAPTAQVSATGTLSGNLAFVQGLAWDTFPTTRAPARVEVSVDGGRFWPALLSATRSAAHAAAAAGGISTAKTRWRYPLRLTREDGKVVQVVARAVDEAGNVSSSTRSLAVVLDNIGPKVTLAQSGAQLRGTIRDGSGVAGLKISLDGGAHTLPVARQGENWTFDMRSWSGALEPWAFLVATDIHGNVTRLLAPIESPRRLFLPLVRRSR